VKKIKLECFTTNAAIHKFFPISSAKKYIPDWFKGITPTVKKTWDLGLESDVSTLKRCEGFTSLYSKGWVLPMWSDLIIETNDKGEYKYQYSGAFDTYPSENAIQGHSPVQLGNNFPDHIHIKLVVPWFIRESTGVDFYYGENTWGIKQLFDDITIPPGVLNFKNQHGAHINLFLRKKNTRLIIEHNTPLIHCIPLSNLPLEIENNLVSDQEYKHLQQLATYRFSFLGTYKNKFKLLQEK